MIRLAATTSKLQIFLSGSVAANQPVITVSYKDQFLTLHPGATQISTANGASVVDICDAPTVVNVVRNVDSIQIANNDTASVTVTVRRNDNGTLTNLITQAIAASKTLGYSVAGWDAGP